VRPALHETCFVVARRAHRLPGAMFVTTAPQRVCALWLSPPRGGSDWAVGTARCGPLLRPNKWHSSRLLSHCTGVASVSLRLAVPIRMPRWSMFLYSACFELNLTAFRPVKFEVFTAGDYEEWCLLLCYAVWLL
jgi:hypothetical protein